MTWVNRMKSGLRRMGDWITGHDVDVTDQPPAELLQDRPTVRPAIDVLESNDEILVVADTPGAFPGATYVHVDGGRLTVLARAHRAADGHLLLGGVTEADWHFDLALPDVVDPDAIHAAVRDGVLSLHLPKRPRPEPRRIAVTTS